LPLADILQKEKFILNFKTAMQVNGARWLLSDGIAAQHAVSK
jgi:hypothetical protein